MLFALRHLANPLPLANDHLTASTALPSLCQKVQTLRLRPSADHPLMGRFVVFDTETTGFNYKRGDEIISLGAVAVDNGEVTKEYFTEFVNPYRPIPETTTKLTGITNSMVAPAPDILTVLDQFLDFKGTTPLVAHNASFDLNFINHKLRKYCGYRLTTATVDTFVLSSLLRPLEETHTLDDLALAYEVPLKGRHTALGDSIITAHIFTKMVQQLFAKGIKTTYQLANYLQLRRLI